MEHGLYELSSGRRIRLFTVIDDFTKQCHAMTVDFSINGLRVARELTRLLDLYGKREAQDVIERWRISYNNHRPHSALNWATPNEFASLCSGLTRSRVDKIA